VRVVYPGFDPARFHGEDGAAPRRQPGPPYVLYVGNLLPHKNVLRLVEAFALLRRRGPCRLVIRGAGRPGYARAVRGRVEALGLTDDVSFAAYADSETLRELYAGATCLVLPSLAEGFGLPILEAMASGTPVVTSSVSALAEVAGGAAVTADPYDPAALADAMGRVLSEPELRAELRQRGLERVRHFSWERTAAAISGLIDELLPGGA
jgi:glycosyltransferase involved in cell wall biosynthesis